MPIKPPKSLGGGKNIPAPKEYNPKDPLHLSFKLLDIKTNEKFSLKHCGNQYLEKLLLRLVDLNRLTVGEFREFKKEWRNHEIKFDQTTEPEGFKQLPEQTRANEAWQFQLTKGQHGRIHGLLIDNLFFVVWLDPCHQLYPDEKTNCNH